MVAIFAALVGVLTGWYRASKMGGTLTDRVFYGVVHGIVFFLVALVVTIVIGWTGWV